MTLKYLSHYSETTREQVVALIKAEKLPRFLTQKYPVCHNYKTDKTLYDYTLDIKNSYLKKTQPISKVVYDGKIHVINNALGLHTFASRVQGSKLKSKNEIRIASMFKNVPEQFLRMIIVHELAHLKEKEHNKAFYKLCEHMEPSYHQLEFDTRLYLTCIDHFGKLY
ncbi:M48 family metallopeptidase [Sulfurimonas sp. HSL3-7]|uniref:M48 metallopeptidase family protein n=1 Tax=Sulfonitrofixus jiaomeiensis TaxID=3131938 RepID=UPI0031F768C5